MSDLTLHIYLGKLQGTVALPPWRSFMTCTQYALKLCSMRSHPRTVHSEECFLGTSIGFGDPSRRLASGFVGGVYAGG